MKFSEVELGYVKKALLEYESCKDVVEKFEGKFADHLNVKYAAACNSGTSGLHAALFAAGITAGDEVIIPGLTVIMDAFAVMYLGAKPIFVDVNIDTHLIDVEDIEKNITSNTKAILTVSWEGLICDMDAINLLAKRRGLIVIDDSARTIDGFYKGKVAGQVADITVFSFESKKHLTTGGEGGMVVTNNEKFATKARKFIGIGYKHLSAIAGATDLALPHVQDPNYLRFDCIGPNYRLNQISAAVGIGQLERIEEIINKRKEIGKIFLEGTVNIVDWFIPQKTPDDCVHAYYTFSSRYTLNEKGKTWKDFYNEYKRRGGDGFYGCVMNPYLEPALVNRTLTHQKYSKGLCPNAEKIQQQAMCFKTNYRSIDQAKFQVEVLNKLLNNWNL